MNKNRKRYLLAAVALAIALLLIFPIYWMVMSAILFKPNGRVFTMKHGPPKHWLDEKSGRLYLTSAKYYETAGNTLADPKAIPGTNTVLQFQAKTGMVKILDGAEQ